VWCVSCRSCGPCDALHSHGGSSPGPCEKRRHSLREVKPAHALSPRFNWSNMPRQNLPLARELAPSACRTIGRACPRNRPSQASPFFLLPHSWLVCVRSEGGTSYCPSFVFLDEFMRKRGFRKIHLLSRFLDRPLSPR
jgi:hypothetical protein